MESCETHLFTPSVVYEEQSFYGRRLPVSNAVVKSLYTFKKKYLSVFITVLKNNLCILYRFLTLHHSKLHLLFSACSNGPINPSVFLPDYGMIINMSALCLLQNQNFQPS